MKAKTIGPACSVRKIFPAFALLVMALFFSPLASAGESVRGAVHRGTIEGETIVWRSQYNLEGQSTVRLAAPLPTNARVDRDAGVVVIEERGQIVGFSSIDPGARSVAIVIHEALPRVKDRVQLIAPLADGDAVQVVDVSGAGGLHFEPAPESSLERRVGYYAAPGFAKHTLAEDDGALGYRKRQAGDLPLYVRATPALASGIDGTVSTESMRTRTGAIGAGVIFVAMIAALGAAYRKVAGAARFERAERTLEEEFARMESQP